MHYLLGHDLLLSRVLSINKRCLREIAAEYARNKTTTNPNTEQYDLENLVEESDAETYKNHSVQS